MDVRVHNQPHSVLFVFTDVFLFKRTHIEYLHSPELVPGNVLISRMWINTFRNLDLKNCSMAPGWLSRKSM